MAIDVQTAGGFVSDPERCWRMIRDPEPRHQGHPVHCLEPVRWRGRYTSSEARSWTVWSCDSHRHGLGKLQRMSSDR